MLVKICLYICKINLYIIKKDWKKRLESIAAAESMVRGDKIDVGAVWKLIAEYQLMFCTLKK
jgi:hypothetical protein